MQRVLGLLILTRASVRLRVESGAAVLPFALALEKLSSGIEKRECDACRKQPWVTHCQCGVLRTENLLPPGRTIFTCNIIRNNFCFYVMTLRFLSPFSLVLAAHPLVRA